MKRRVTIQGQIDDLMLADLREVIAGRAAIIEVIDPAQPLRLAELIGWTHQAMDVPVDAIIGQRRDQRSVAARDVVVWGARALSTMSFAAIGRRLGGREHSTIVAAHRRITARREVDPCTADLLAAMQAHFGQDAAA